MRMRIGRIWLTLPFYDESYRVALARIPLNSSLNVPCGCARCRISGPNSSTRPLPTGASIAMTPFSRYLLAPRPTAAERRLAVEPGDRAYARRRGARAEPEHGTVVEEEVGVLGHAGGDRVRVRRPRPRARIRGRSTWCAAAARRSPSGDSRRAGCSDAARFTAESPMAITVPPFSMNCASCGSVVSALTRPTWSRYSAGSRSRHHCPGAPRDPRHHRLVRLPHRESRR